MQPDKPKPKPSKKPPPPTRLVKRVRPVSMELEPYAKALRAGLPGGPPKLDPARPPPTVAAVPAIPAAHRPHLEEKPFDPVGVELGDLRLLPTIEEDVGYASNRRCCRGRPRPRSMRATQGGLAFQSDWSRNDLHGSLTGGYTDYFEAHEADSPNAAALLGGRIDASHDLSFDGEGRFNLATQTPGSVTCRPALRSPPRGAPSSRPSTPASAAPRNSATSPFRCTACSTASITRTPSLADGSNEKLSSDDYNDWGLGPRRLSDQPGHLAFRSKGSSTPARYDQTVDFTGFERNSTGALARVGATVALSGQLTGEASIGYGERHYRDPRLPVLRAPLIDASLIWSATPLTTVTLKTSSESRRHDQRRRFRRRLAQLLDRRLASIAAQPDARRQCRLRHRRLRRRALCRIRR